MKNVLYFILALVIAWIVWKIAMIFIAKALGILFMVALIAVFCFIVFAIFQAMTKKQKNIL